MVLSDMTQSDDVLGVLDRVSTLFPPARLPVCLSLVQWCSPLFDAALPSNQVGKRERGKNIAVRCLEIKKTRTENGMKGIRTGGA